MTHFIQNSCVTLLKMLPLVLMLLAGFAWAEDGILLSTDELESLIKGATRVGKYSGGTYYLTFQNDGSYCLRLDSNEAGCVEKGPWWFEGNTVCRRSDQYGEYCWNVTELGDNKFRSKITRTKNSMFAVGETDKFWVE